jgi:hypothetical protein
MRPGLGIRCPLVLDHRIRYLRSGCHRTVTQPSLTRRKCSGPGVRRPAEPGAWRGRPRSGARRVPSSLRLVLRDEALEIVEVEPPFASELDHRKLPTHDEPTDSPTTPEPEEGSRLLKREESLRDATGGGPRPGDRRRLRPGGEALDRTHARPEGNLRASMAPLPAPRPTARQIRATPVANGHLRAELGGSPCGMLRFVAVSGPACHGNRGWAAAERRT